MRKKGFWIKKDGNIAVDMRMPQKETNKLARLDKRKDSTQWVYTKSLDRKKFVQSIAILRKRLNLEYQYKMFYIRRWKSVESNANVLVKKIRAEARATLFRYKKAYKKSLKATVDERVKNGIANIVAKIPQNKNCKFYGIISFNFIYDFCLREGLKREAFFLLQQISFYEVFHRGYLKNWSVEETHLLKRCFQKLKDLGYIEVHTRRSGAYIITLIGRELLNRFDKEYEAYLAKAINIAKYGKPTIRK